MRRCISVLSPKYLVFRGQDTGCHQRRGGDFLLGYQCRNSNPGGSLSKPSSLIMVLSFWFSTVAFTLGSAALVFKTSATYLARGSEISPRGIIANNSAKPRLKAQMPLHARRGRPSNGRREPPPIAPVSRLICSMICELKNSGFQSSRRGRLSFKKLFSFRNSALSESRGSRFRRIATPRRRVCHQAKR